MKPKSIIAAVLLLFVAASVAVLIAKGIRETPEAGAEANPAADAPAMTDGVIAYYFHGKTRCPTCKSIESYAHEAIQTGFAEPLEGRRLAWRVVNYELPENAHFRTEYELLVPTVVLVEMDGGSRKEWKNLARVWELVGDKGAFVEYIQGETRAMLEGPT